MSVSGGPNVVENGLVFYLDVANRKGISPAGCTEFNNASQLVKNIISPSDTISSFGGIRLGNVNYFTIFSIDYPEGSFGGDAAGRDGITAGYNVRSGNKAFDFGRALNYAVWDKNTQTFVKTSIYDSYVGTSAVDTFVAEYTVATQTWTNAVHIVAGSHRDSYHTQAQYNILRDLGAPSNVNSIIEFSSPEWILVGEPGLGPGNGVWAFQNYTTDADRVAHVNVGLPIFGGTDNYLQFDGIDDYLSIPSINFSQEQTIEIWLKPTENDANRRNPYNQAYGGYGTWTHESDGTFNYYYGDAGANNSPYIGHNSSFTVVQNELACVCTTRDTSSSWWYKNGIRYTSYNHSYGTLTTDNNNILIGTGYAGGYNGNIYAIKLYNRALTPDEVLQNFNATRSRFNI